MARSLPPKRLVLTQKLGVDVREEDSNRDVGWLQRVPSPYDGPTRPA